MKAEFKVILLLIGMGEEIRFENLEERAKKEKFNGSVIETLRSMEKNGLVTMKTSSCKKTARGIEKTKKLL
jgi:Mn-dependent DtxR family transcriptional regulator